MKKVEIVGAGLAGLTAAINLVQEGHEVTVYEKEKKIGGTPIARPDPAGSPFNLKKLKHYIGIDISPAAHFLERTYQMLWGKQYVLKSRPEVPIYMIERGSRKTSLDALLYKKAKETGVKIKFGQRFNTKKDFMDLPPNSIIATGLERVPYQVLGIPYKESYAYMAKGTVDHNAATVTIFMADYTTDYAFTGTVNGICYAMLYQREKPLSKADLEKFAEEVRQVEDFSLTPWKEVDIGVVPFKAYNTPQLFYGDKIIAGSMAGAIDPLMGFGMLGALLSGKIAAMAIHDRDKALKEFRRMNILYNPELFIKNLWAASPAFIRRTYLRFTGATYDYAPSCLINKSYIFVPGYGRMG